MEIERSDFASKGVAGAGLGLGIAGTALGLLNGNGLGGIFGGNPGMMCQEISLSTGTRLHSPPGSPSWRRR